MSSDCLACDNFKFTTLSTGKPLRYEVYSRLTLKRRLALCDDGDTPKCLYCIHENYPTDVFVYPPSCRFGKNCLACTHLLVTTLSHKTPIPMWMYDLLDVDQRISLSLSHNDYTIIYCSKKKKSPLTFRMVPNCEGYEGE